MTTRRIFGVTGNVAVSPLSTSLTRGTYCPYDKYDNMLLYSGTKFPKAIMFLSGDNTGSIFVDFSTMKVYAYGEVGYEDYTYEPTNYGFYSQYLLSSGTLASGSVSDMYTTPGTRIRFYIIYHTKTKNWRVPVGFTIQNGTYQMIGYTGYSGSYVQYLQWN